MSDTWLTPEERWTKIQSDCSERHLSSLWSDVFAELVLFHEELLVTLRLEREALLTNDFRALEGVLGEKQRTLLKIDGADHALRVYITEINRSMALERFSDVLDWFESYGTEEDIEQAKKCNQLRGKLVELLKEVQVCTNQNVELIQHGLRYVHDLRVHLDPSLDRKVQYGKSGERRGLMQPSRQLEQEL